MTYFHRIRAMLIVAISLLAAGCAGVKYENGLAVADGWRKGTIMSIGNGPEYLDRIPERCASQHSANQYALIRYSDGHLRSRSYAVEDVAAFHSGDKVYFNINTCSLLSSAPSAN